MISPNSLKSCLPVRAERNREVDNFTSGGSRSAFAEELLRRISGLAISPLRMVHSHALPVPMRDPYHSLPCAKAFLPLVRVKLAGGRLTPIVHHLWHCHARRQWLGETRGFRVPCFSFPFWWGVTTRNGLSTNLNPSQHNSLIASEKSACKFRKSRQRSWATLSRLFGIFGLFFSPSLRLFHWDRFFFRLGF